MRTFFQSDRGSVMMEFIIVFPIYLVLFAAIMAVGDTLVHSIRLPSAERTAAFDIGEWEVDRCWDRVADTLFHPGVELADGPDSAGNENQDELDRENELHHVADTQVAGPWSVLAGVTVRNRYKLLAGGTAGQLAFCDWFFADVTGGSQTEGDFGVLIGGADRVEMHSKRVDAAGETVVYNYYTLKRKRYQEGADGEEDHGMTWRNHNRNPVDLMADSGYESGNRRWKDCVAKEAWHTEFAGAEDSEGEPLDTTAGSARYTRYTQFVNWSN